MLDISKLACQGNIRETPYRIARDVELRATADLLAGHRGVGCRENGDRPTHSSVSEPFTRGPPVVPNGRGPPARRRGAARQSHTRPASGRREPRSMCRQVCSIIDNSPRWRVTPTRKERRRVNMLFYSSGAGVL
jgi:hypothetical protein